MCSLCQKHLTNISTLKYCECICSGFARSECMNYLLKCNAKLYVLVTVWEMIVYVYISMGGTKIQSELILVPPMVYLYWSTISRVLTGE
jgi:hypothetical protein